MFNPQHYTYKKKLLQSRNSFVLFIKNKKILYVQECFACLYVCTLCNVWCLRNTEEAIGSPGTGYEPLSGCWDSNLGEDPVLLTTEPTLQHSSFAFNSQRCVSIFSCIWSDPCMCVYTCGGQRTTFGTLQETSTCVLRPSLIKPGACQRGQAGWPVRPKALPVPGSPAVQQQGVQPQLAF